MNKVINYIVPILSTAWNGALVFVCFIVFTSSLFTIFDKLFNNNLFSCCIVCLSLIGLTFWLGSIAKEKRKSRNGGGNGNC